MKKYEAVIFDAGGVLHESNSALIDDLISELGIEQDVIQKIWADQLLLLNTGIIQEDEFWKQVKKVHGIRQVDVAENLLGRAFIKELKIHAPVIELIRELRQNGVKLAVLSNTIEPHAKALSEVGLYDCFDFIILSHEVKMRKPYTAIYEHTLEVLGTKPEKTIFVDDSQRNVQAAEALGIKGVLFVEVGKAVDEIRSLIIS